MRIVLNYNRRLSWAKDEKESKDNLIHMFICSVSKNAGEHGYDLSTSLRKNGGSIWRCFCRSMTLLYDESLENLGYPGKV